jgi:hypothetical protein
VALLAAAPAVALSACSAFGNAPTANPLPSAKQAMLDNEKAGFGRGGLAPDVSKPSVVLPQGTPYRIPARQGGLSVDANQGPFGATEFKGNTMWQGAINGSWIQVYAGIDLVRSAPTGALRVYSLPLDPNAGPTDMTDLGIARPPTREASLTITSVNGTVLTLSAPSGDRFLFNIATGTWQAG